jgi:diacylglycerol kinase family enzyme
MRKFLLLVNPVLQQTGRRRGDVARVTQIFRDAGVSADVMETGEDRAAGPKARRAAAEGYDAVVVFGGDGTIFDVIQGIAGLSLPLGIIPFGTGNVLAQNLKVPKDPVAAARWILRSGPRSVPLGKITCCTPEGRQSWFFAMAAGMGVHAELMSAARRAGKSVAGGQRITLPVAGCYSTIPCSPSTLRSRPSAGLSCETRHARRSPCAWRS